MTEKRYVIPYSLDAQKRHYHKTGKGRIIEFVVQLEVFVTGEWKQVVRYDCAHDFAHRDLYNLKGERKKEELQMSYEGALTFADDDIDDNWEVYRERFLREGCL